MLPNVVQPADPTTLELLTRPRVTEFRFDMLGKVRLEDGTTTKEGLIGYLDGVEGGSVKIDGYGSVKGAGTIDVVQTAQDVDWVNIRIRPVAVISHPDGAGQPYEAFLGVYLAAAPVAKHSGSGVRYSVEIMDKMAILDQDVMTDASGLAITYGLAAGTNIIATVKSIISSSGEDSPSIEPSSKVLAGPQTWEMGTTKLRIINDLLEQGNFFSLWCDGGGNYRTSPYVEPDKRTPVYGLVSPLVEGSTSLFDPEWTLDHDIYSIPNRMIAVGQGDQTTPAKVATVTNEDATSPFSYQNRGRWITVVDTGIEAADDAALLAYARRRMTNLSSAAVDVQIKHLLLPALTVDSVVRFAAGDWDFNARIINTTIPFDPVALVTTSLRMV